MSRRWGAGLVVTVLVAAATLVPTIGRAADATCTRTPMPYAGLAGASLAATDHTSGDDPPVTYTRWRGTVPGFDGMPFSVDVTVPCGVTGRMPTVVMLHGFTDDKTIWQETGKGDSVISRDRPAANSYWNNVWFVSQGYVVVNYTARGWRDSCGPETPGGTRLAPPARCLRHEYWIHLDDKRWEVRDAQWLAGGLVQSGLADPARLAITGGSYGGAPTASAALLAGNVMCGAAPQPAALGPDPCAGRPNGALAPWTTPDGRTRLNWVAAVPLYTFADLIQVLAPNGRGSDGWALAPPDGDHTRPFGVPIASTLVGLLAAGVATGFFAPPGLDPHANIVLDGARLLAGDPFPTHDPFVRHGVRVYRTFKSPITSAPQGRVPMFWVHGFTDPLFPAFEVLQMLASVRRADPAYPMKVFLGDLGHDYTGDRRDEWDYAHGLMNAFLDHFLRPDRTPVPSTYDVTATVTRCLDHDAPMRVARAATWHELHPHHTVLVSEHPGVTTNVLPGPAALATDPVTGATLPLPGSYKGCRIVSPARADPTAVTRMWDVADDLVLMGGPVVSLSYMTTAPDTALHVRVWDVAADGSTQGLVTRGVYRAVGGPGPATIRFQLAPQGYRFPAGHRIKVEVAANDAPYYQPTKVPTVVRVTRLEVAVPLLERPA
jgi:hypothetical protein